MLTSQKTKNRWGKSIRQLIAKKIVDFVVTVSTSVNCTARRKLEGPNLSLRKSAYLRFPHRWLLLAAVVVFGGIRTPAEEITPYDSLFSEMPDELKLFRQPPVVITAARKPQKITEAPSTIDVITVEDIQRSGALTLAELLERLPGIYTPTAHNALDMLWIRGVGGRYNDNALLLIDGVPYRTLFYSNFPINEQIPLEDIQKIEVIRGPGSALYGTNAFTGVINIITKTAKDIKNNEVAVSFGSWNTQNHHLLLGAESEKGEFSVLAKYLDSHGYKVGTDDEGNRTDNRRAADNQAYNLKLRNNHFDLTARYSKFSLNDFTQTPDEGEEGDQETREHFLTQVGYHQDFGQKLSLQVKAYLNYYNLEASGTGLGDVLNALLSSETEINGRIAGVDILSMFNFSERHTLLLGVNYEYEYLDHAWTKTRISPADPVELTIWAATGGGDQPRSIDNSNWASYLEDELRIGEKLILTTGLRFDSFEASESRFSPRFSLIYLPDNKTGIKLRYGEAFRAPTYQELYRQEADGEGEGNQNLKPQIIKTAEFEVSRFLTDNHRLSLTLFKTDFENFIKVIGDGDFENLNKQEYYGFELGLDGKLQENLSYFANYSFTEGEQSDGTDIGGLPEHIGNVGFAYTGFKYLDIVPHLRWVGDRNLPKDYQGDVNPVNRQRLLGRYGILNLTFLSKNLPGRLNVSLSIRNLLDKTYYTPGEQTQDFDIRQPGRRVLLKFSLKF